MSEFTLIARVQPAGSTVDATRTMVVVAGGIGGPTGRTGGLPDGGTLGQVIINIGPGFGAWRTLQPGDIGAEDVGVAQALIDELEAAADPFPQYQTKGEKGQPNGYVPLGPDSLIPAEFIPPFTILTPHIVGSEAEMLALNGGIAVRTDIGETFILSDGGDPTVLGDWIELPNPTSPLVRPPDGKEWELSGDIITSLGEGAWTPPEDRTIAYVLMRLGVAADTEDVVGDIRKNGTTSLWTNPADRPTIPVGEVGPVVAVPNIVALTGLASVVDPADADFLQTPDVEHGDDTSGSTVIFQIVFA